MFDINDTYRKEDTLSLPRHHLKTRGIHKPLVLLYLGVITFIAVKQLLEPPMRKEKKIIGFRTCNESKKN